MTVDEFKELNPKHKDLEGDQLWNAMEDHMLRQQQGEAIIRQIMPIWKTHTFRWLFYRKVPNLIMGNPKYDKYNSSVRCKSCKWGVNARWGYMITAEDGTQRWTSFCPHCRKEYHEEPNTNFTYRIYLIGKWISNAFWTILDRLHLVRSSSFGRHEMFGDESIYVSMWSMNFKTGKTEAILKKRKWWEYILIENRKGNLL